MKIKLYSNITKCMVCENLVGNFFTISGIAGGKVKAICRICANEMYFSLGALTPQELGERISPLLTEHPLSETSKLKDFTDVFNGLSTPDKWDVEETKFINCLMLTGKFTKDEAKEFIRKAMQNGQIYERRKGFYAKA